MGYLSLRESQLEGYFLLDFPNLEILKSISRLVVEKIFGSPSEASKSGQRFKKALSLRDPVGVTNEINFFLSKIPYEDYQDGDRNKLTDHFYYVCLIGYLRGIGLDFTTEEHEKSGRSDLIIILEPEAWVIAIKVCREGESDQSMAQAAFDKIIKK
jgi:hypothetical protein